MTYKCKLCARYVKSIDRLEHRNKHGLAFDINNLFELIADINMDCESCHESRSGQKERC